MDSFGESIKSLGHPERPEFRVAPETPVLTLAQPDAPGVLARPDAWGWRKMAR